MSLDSLLIFGSAFLLILAVSQLLVPRKRTANYWLSALFIASFLWTAHACAYRLGAIELFPHLNKIYLPLLCLTGLFWYNYVRSLFDGAAQWTYDRRDLLPSVVCLTLSIPFYLQNASFKRQYIEINVTDVPTATMYAASRLAELTLVANFIRTLFFIRKLDPPNSSDKRHVLIKFLWAFTLIALVASIIRFFGSIAGSDTISVIVPSIMAIVIVLCMHFLSFRIPTILSLGKASRQIQIHSGGTESLNDIREQLRTRRLFLDPNLKVQSLARKLGIPTQELSSLINAVEGANFNRFINELRIDYAKTLLKSESDMTILDVCYASGFNSKNTFNTSFKEQTSMTPSEFRRTN